MKNKKNHPLFIFSKTSLSLALVLSSIAATSFAQNAISTSAPAASPTSMHAKTNHPLKVFQSIDESNFAAFKTEPAAVLLVKADWCSTCKSQIHTLTELKKDPRYQKIKLFMIDYDQQKNILKELKVTSQSTIIAFQKGQELDRLIAQDSATALKNLLDKSQ